MAAVGSNPVVTFNLNDPREDIERQVLAFQNHDFGGPTGPVWLGSDVEYFPNGEYVITVSNPADTREVYTKFDDVEKFGEWFDALAMLDLTEMIAELANVRETYIAILITGGGDWHRGTNIIERRARKNGGFTA